MGDRFNGKIVVFDCDGVMFDTDLANRVYYNTILDRFDQPSLTDDQFGYVHMATVKEALSFLFKDTDLLDQVFDYCRNLSYASIIPHMEIEPYLKPLLTRLRSRYHTAIATNRSNTMPMVMEHFQLNDLFDMVVTSLDVEHPKPHPEQLLKIMEQFGVEPEGMLYIGDSKTDEQAAKDAGVCFVAYGNPKLEAHHHIRGLKEVESFIDL